MSIDRPTRHERAPPDIVRPVPIVRLVVRDDEGRVLLLRRASTAYAEGDWSLPGGKVDYGDTVEKAARRELREETALECDDLRFLFIQDSLPLQPGGMHCINIYFEGQARGDLRLNPESSGVAWIRPGDLDRHAIAFHNDEGLRRYWMGDP
jgi:8-oxo-dGTP pyrophosphatase MutT (NUDIX family)